MKMLSSEVKSILDKLYNLRGEDSVILTKMNKERRDQEPMNSGSISMSSQPMADIHYFPYYSPDLQTYSNYPKMGYINNIQAINGYSNPMEFYHEEPHLNQQNKYQITDGTSKII